MNYEEALAFIHGAHKFGKKNNLENVYRFMDFLGNPQENIKFIHIAGTNGKGSTSILLHNILKEQGYQVGLYISPYLEEFTERIQINGKHIDKESLASITFQVKKAIENMVLQGYDHPTEFEIVTGIAFLYFYEKKVDFVVLEVGLGGRLDATNVIANSEVSIITSIGYDHMAELGNSLPEIAKEKAGIIKNKGRVVVYPQMEEVVQVIRERALKKRAEVFLVKRESILHKKKSIEGQIFSYEGELLSFPNIETKLLGEHQLYNIATVLKAIEVLMKRGYEITNQAILDGIKKTFWPGRFEILSKNPYIILDGAHNSQGAEIFYRTIREYFPNKQIILALGILRDKNVDEMLKIFLPLAKEVITLTPNNPRAMTSIELSEKIQSMNFNRPVQAINSIEQMVAYIKQIKKEEIIAFTGSLYMIGEVRKNLKGL
ncbi:bifunctional folylpolyglutamate synthase/dihydrofolate synthase [Garciella nitratireducens]|uniref:tetrahydrofolate synthase n=1 Tax=Garciella nitratireducens DSM 15102 TaxID=1121911 RepID=A0A1T4LLA2_9FIRM|nr:folylpolyglutamate synthase/dihydrofolate synthase family protein [Garciella nitratireducens]RBP46857.1 dihydrofolate synthase/folylpolyglutamate synthase [Garciella nitratireducens]SJZ55416.1 dihydrofolate synthase / folylpolyglutamate synthase [Garciella nitratireducens DSM 15102]